jgi:hypothetical protein
MTEPNIRNVKVAAQDIESVSEKLHAFAKELPPGEQNVMAWLLGRAAQAPPESADFLHPLSESTQLSLREQLSHSLGVPQFARLRPGSAVAGSSIGVTGTVMF